MALIKCKNCGNMVSDKAARCPKCGTEVHREEPLQPMAEETPEKVEATTPHFPESPAEKEVDNQQHLDDVDNNRGGLVKWIIAVVIAGLLCGAAYYFYNRHQENLAAIELAEKHRADSIAAVNRELARLDSLRQDSIEFCKFTSSDLRVFELHGKVKSVTYESLGVGPLSKLFKVKSFNFDENGTLANKPGIFNLSKLDDFVLKWLYTSNDFPSEGVFMCCDEECWKYNPEGQLKEYRIAGGPGENETIYEYDEKGFLASVSLEDVDNYYYEAGKGSVKFDEVDKWGNWTKRTITVSYYEKRYTENSDPKPMKGYILTKDQPDGSYVYIKEYTKSYTESRTICYYRDEYRTK